MQELFERLYATKRRVQLAANVVANLVPINAKVSDSGRSKPRSGGIRLAHGEPAVGSRLEDPG